MKNIIVIEDDRELCELLKEFFQAENFELETVHDGLEGLRRVSEGNPDLVILDVMLPGINGFDVLKKIRERSKVPVIMLTARGEDIDRILGLEMGADDYLPKPFNTRELLARVKAILRRSEEKEEPEKNIENPSFFKIGDLEVYPSSHNVRQGENNLELTHIEFKLLLCLLESAGKIISRQTLVLKVLKRAWSPFDRSIDVHMSNLRKKLGPLPDGSERIKTLRGEGYFYSIMPEEKGE